MLHRLPCLLDPSDLKYTPKMRNVNYYFGVFNYKCNKLSEFFYEFCALLLTNVRYREIIVTKGGLM